MSELIAHAVSVNDLHVELQELAADINRDIEGTGETGFAAIAHILDTLDRIGKSARDLKADVIADTAPKMPEDTWTDGEATLTRKASPKMTAWDLESLNRDALKASALKDKQVAVTDDGEMLVPTQYREGWEAHNRVMKLAGNATVGNKIRKQLSLEPDEYCDVTWASTIKADIK